MLVEVSYCFELATILMQKGPTPIPAIIYTAHNNKWDF